MNIFKRFFSRIKIGLADMLYPQHIKCIFCHDELIDLNNFDCCEKCMRNLPFITSDCCFRCGNQMPKDSVGVCKNCKANNFEFDRASSVFRYDDNLRPTIYKLKYSSAKYLAEPLAYYLYVKFCSLKWKVDIITSIPLHENRIKDRGYNQAKELAIELARLTNITYQDLAIRKIDNPSQTSLNIKQRKANVKDIFAHTNEKVKGKNILIIDDIYTTGATVNEMSKILKKANTNKVYVLTLAHSIFKEDI